MPFVSLSSDTCKTGLNNIADLTMAETNPFVDDQQHEDGSNSKARVAADDAEVLEHLGYKPVSQPFLFQRC